MVEDLAGSTPIPDLEFLRASGAAPRWFGLGFVQLKIDEATRLHVWHPDLPGQGFEEELHDHRYEFTSKVLRGSVVHEVWAFDHAEDGDHEIVEVACEPGVEADPRPVARGRPRLAGRYGMAEGSVYTFPPTEFHAFRATKAATLLTRGPKVKDLARVARRIGAPSACPFAVEIPEDVLWDKIADVMGGVHRPGYHLRPIAKGVLGEASKIREETEEFLDAVEQGVSVMGLVELSDLVGAVEAYLARHHPSIGIADLRIMSDVTRRAFLNGRR